jgi:mannose-6-phosphate isomerase-like protein (cupin superfamily)
MQAFTLAELMARRAAGGEAWLEFLRVPELSMGIYTLPAGGVDGQSPHSEGEVYYIVAGRAMIVVGGEERAVAPGDLIYVAAGVEHRFFAITEELTALVFFAPAEYSQAA